MATLVFVCEEHEEYGGNGWRPIDKPRFDPLSGMAVAHDIMEHNPRGTESTADELMAFGASIYVRKDYYRDRQANRPSSNFAGEIGDMLRKIMYGEVDQIAHCPFRPNVRGNEYVNAEINHVISELKSWCESETDGELKLSIVDEQNIRGWLAEGYRRTVKRYQGVKQYYVLSTFQQIEKQADEYLKHAEIGDQLTVRIWKRAHIGWSELDFKVVHRCGYGLEER